MNCPLVRSVNIDVDKQTSLLEEFGSRLVISDYMAQCLSEAACQEHLSVRMRWQRFVKACWPKLGSAQRLHVNDHCKAVALMASTMAQEAEMSLSMARKLHTASLLHDVGKCFIPDQLLDKPGRLTDDQWQIMNLHSAASGWIAGKLGADDEIVAMVLNHHRPYSDCGEDSSESTRMLTVADAYVTMCSNRSYSAAMPPSEALAELERCKVVQFDPAAVSMMYRICKCAA